MGKSKLSGSSLSGAYWLEFKVFAPADEVEAFRDPLLRRAGAMVRFFWPAADALVPFFDFDARLFMDEIYED